MSDYAKFKKASQARRQQVQESIADALGVSANIREARAARDSQKTHRKLVAQNAGPEAVSYVRSFLGQFSVPRQLKLTYAGMRSADRRTGSTEIDSAVITVHGEFTTGVGRRVHFDVPMEVRAGEFLDPSLIVTDHGPRIIAQSTFDDLAATYTTFHNPPVREMYAPPRPGPASHPSVERANRGMFASAEAKTMLRRAMQGKSPIAESDLEVEAAKAPQAPKPPGMKPPKMPGANGPGSKGPKPPAPAKPGAGAPKVKPDTRRPCAKCHQSPCVCADKRKKKAQEEHDAGFADSLLKSLVKSPDDAKRQEQNKQKDMASADPQFMASLAGKQYHELADMFNKMQRTQIEARTQMGVNKGNQQWIAQQRKNEANLQALGNHLRAILNQHRLDNTQEVNKNIIPPDGSTPAPAPGQAMDQEDTSPEVEQGHAEASLRLAERGVTPDVMALAAKEVGQLKEQGIAPVDIRMAIRKKYNAHVARQVLYDAGLNPNK